MLKISFEEAAGALEQLCDRIETSEELTVQLRELFAQSKLQLQDAVDGRIKHLMYIESQVEMAELMIKSWQNRLKRLKGIEDFLETNTVQFMQAYPDLPYKGMLGTLKLQNNSAPKLITEGIDLETSEYMLWEKKLDTTRLKKDLLEGKEVEGARLERGQHLRIKTK